MWSENDISYTRMKMMRVNEALIVHRRTIVCTSLFVIFVRLQNMS